MRRQRLRVELRLDGELKARYQGRYLLIEPRAVRPPCPRPTAGGAQTTPQDGKCPAGQRHLDAGLL